MRVVSTFGAGPASLFHHPQEIWNPELGGYHPRKKLGIGTEGGHPGENWQWGSRRDHLVNWLRCAFLNGAKSTLAMFPETNLVWTVLRAIWGIRNALLQVRG